MPSNLKIYLLNDVYPTNLPGESNVVDHTKTDPSNKKEFFYNRTALDMIFNYSQDFTLRFADIKFYEVDMIPFFRYTTEANVDTSIKSPLMGVPSYNAPSGTIYTL